MGGKVFICGINTKELPKLKEREQKELLEKIKLGDNEAREKFIISNFRLVLSIIKRFKIDGVNTDDVFQAGVIGLIKAIDNFDISFNVKFSTYAVPMIIGEVKRFIKGGNSLRVPRSIRDMAYKVLKKREEIERNHRDATIENIAQELNVAVSDVSYCLDAISDTVSLFEPVYNKEGEELLLIDQISNSSDCEEIWTESVALTSAINNLEEREKSVIKLRYFEGRTQTEISEEIGISQAQVSRIEKTALIEIKNRIMV